MQHHQASIECEPGIFLSVLLPSAVPLLLQSCLGFYSSSQLCKFFQILERLSLATETAILPSCPESHVAAHV